MADAEPKTIDLVCVGLREIKGGKLLPAFAEFDGDLVHDDRAAIEYDAQTPKADRDAAMRSQLREQVYVWNNVSAKPGHVYRFKIDSWTDDSRVIIGKPEYRCVWPSAGDRLRWHAEADAKTNLHRLAKLRDKAEGKRELVSATKALAETYKRMDYAGRTAFLMRVTELIVHHPEVK